MPLYAVHEVSNGKLKSVGTVLPEQLPGGHAALVLASPPGDGIWNPTTLVFDPRPPVVPVDRVQDFITGAAWSAVYASLTVTRQTTTRNALAAWLGAARYRLPSEPYVVKE